MQTGKIKILFEKPYAATIFPNARLNKISKIVAALIIVPVAVEITCSV